ncbi:hypothetical protein [Rummeliibacillus stabekisii]|uniref:Lipoprotein n=1 Tax=Rummeliibacillus stabekisii TaxID=241244 RepID=A0A143HFC8_9BACL|nr:hypothetical protein [Rummeliibacillus stabekisii]AMX00448.1 hypothetical protein ATY39_14115 [Rummeliibacillus stabekisii]
MKRIWSKVLAGLIVTGLLGGCNSNETSNEKPDKAEVTQTTTKSELQSNKDTSKDGNTSTSANENKKGFVKDGILTKKGEWTLEEDGSKITLIKIIEPNKEIDAKPMNLKIKNIKLLERTNISETTQEDIKWLFDKTISKKLNTIQFSYDVENTSKKDISFSAFDKITTNTKIQIDGMQNLISNNDPQEYMGEVKTEGVLVVPYFKDNFDGLNELNILTGDVYDTNDTSITYHEPVKVQLKF